MRSKSTREPINPSGLCECGCGESAPIAPRTNSCFGHVKGEAIRFIAGHQFRSKYTRPEPINPSGLCQCGCGQTTNLFVTSDFKSGQVAGDFQRFIFGHQTRLSGSDYIEEDRGYETPCWIWQRAINKRWGYGHENGRRAHVVGWERVNGPVPEGMDLDHLCRVRSCVNPDHLEPVSRAVNIQRGDKAKLTPEKVREIRELAGHISTAEIARRYAVSWNTARDVVHRLTWKNID